MRIEIRLLRPDDDRAALTCGDVISIASSESLPAKTSLACTLARPT